MITKNDKNVIGVYKNNTPISRIYKGDKLVFGEVDYDIIFEWSGGTEIMLLSQTNWKSTSYTTSPVKISTDDYLTLFNVDCDYLKIIKYNPEKTSIDWQIKRINIMDLSELDTSNVTDMHNMFSDCSGLTSLDVSNFNTSNVTDMQGMFANCSSLTSLDVSNFDTSNVINMMAMFSDCSGLTSLDVSNFDTSKVTTMGTMFNGCSTLTSLNLGNFDTSSVTYIIAIFNNCVNLDTIIWNNLGKSSGYNTLDFWNCTKIGQSNHQTLIDTFVNNSFDRASAEYSACRINLHSDVVARFTSEEIAQMTSKGYTISQHS